MDTKKTMEINSKAFGNEYDWAGYSTITEFSFGESGLRLVLSGSANSESFVEVLFTGANAFQVLMECDYHAYWQKDNFRTNHMIYQIKSGGWRDRVGCNYMQVLNVDYDSQTEWLVTANDYCVSVVSGSAPIVREFLEEE